MICLYDQNVVSKLCCIYPCRKKKKISNISVFLLVLFDGVEPADYWSQPVED